jgi:hypothetical protein
MDLDGLAQATNGKCAALIYPQRKQAQQSEEDIVNNVSNEMEVSTFVLPKTVDQARDSMSIQVCSPEGTEQFIQALKASKEAIANLAKLTAGQTASEEWWEYRSGRITASKAYEAAKKVDDKDNIKARHKSTLESILSPPRSIHSEAIEWGRKREGPAKAIYLAAMKKYHQKFTLNDTGFNISETHPYIGASPDGHVNCGCHGEALLEIKNPYT